MTASRFPLALVAALAGALLSAVPAPAHAEVRTTDIVLGKTAEERGIDAVELPDITAKHALVMDRNGTVYFERDADATIKIASVTKVMTALVALEHSQLDEVITVDRNAATVGESAVGLKEGDTLTMEEALIGLMVMSGNDTATAIATHVGAKIDPASADPYATFLAAMNAKAAELGCTNTLYENPHGLDFGRFVGSMHSTAREALVIYAAAMENETFRAIDNSDRTEMHVTSADGTERTLPLLVRNKIRGQEGNIGGKTGSTYEAGDCFVSGFSREVGGEVYVAVFNAENGEMRFNDTLTLANWYYGHLAALPFANTDTTWAGVPVLGEAACTSWTDKTARLTLANKDAATDPVFSLAGAIEQDVEITEFGGDVEKGAAAGTIAYLQDGKAVGEVELVTAEAVEGANPFEWLMVQFDRMVRFFEGKPGVAESVVHNEAPNPLEFDSWGAAA